MADGYGTSFRAGGFYNAPYQPYPYNDPYSGNGSYGENSRPKNPWDNPDRGGSYSSPAGIPIAARGSSGSPYNGPTDMLTPPYGNHDVGAPSNIDFLRPTSPNSQGVGLNTAPPGSALDFVSGHPGEVAGGALMGAGILGEIFGGGNFDLKKVDSAAFLNRYYALTDPRSSENMQSRDFFRKMASDAAPTIATILGGQRASGSSYRTGLAYGQRTAEAEQVKGRDYATNQFERFKMDNERNALGYLSGYSQAEQFNADQENRYNSQQSNVWDTLLSTGAGILSLV